MRAVLQRVKTAAVHISGEETASIKNGWLVLLGVTKNDKESDVSYLVDKTTHLRGFTDSEGKMNLSALDQQFEILVVSQFTLVGDCRKGRRPSFSTAAGKDLARTLYETFVSELQKSGLTVKTGTFQAKMDISLTNDGPVTFLLDSQQD